MRTSNLHIVKCDTQPYTSTEYDEEAVKFMDRLGHIVEQEK